MALSECRECGHQVSTEAYACPSCGAVDPASGSHSGESESSEGGSLTFDSRPTWRSQAGLLLVLFALVLIGFESELGWGVLWLVIPTAGVLLYRRYASRFVIDGDEVRSRHGIIARNMESVHIQNLRSIYVNQDVWERLLGIGDVHFSSAADAVAEVSFHGISDPVGLKEKVQSSRGQATRH